MHFVLICRAVQIVPPPPRRGVLCRARRPFRQTAGGCKGVHERILQGLDGGFLIRKALTSRVFLYATARSRTPQEVGKVGGAEELAAVTFAPAGFHGGTWPEMVFIHGPDVEVEVQT